MVKAILFCKFAKNLRTFKVNGIIQTAGTECEKGYKRCMGQGCKNFIGTDEWNNFVKEHRKSNTN